VNSFAVEVEDLVKTFGNFVAVDHIRFQVEKGEIFGFLGPNGAGKSTTIRMLCGLLMPSSGEGRVAGFDIMKEPERIKEGIGYMSQKFSLYDDLTVVENLHFCGGIYGLSGSLQKEREEEALGMAGLKELRDRMTRTLAVGWKQRLALGCAILHRPEVLFLDEPTSGVDPQARGRFWDLIHAAADKGVTVLVSTHYMDEAEYCNRIALIDRGRVVALGTPRELRRDPRLGGVLVVECVDAARAMAILRQAAGVRDVAVFGQALHVTVADEMQAPERLSALLRERGLQCSRIEAVEPTLEDSFVQLVGRRPMQERPQP